MSHATIRPHAGSLSSLFIPAGRLGTAPQRRFAFAAREIDSGAVRLDSPLGGGYPGVWIWVLVAGSLARCGAVLCKSFVFSYLPIRKVLVLPFWEGREPSASGGFSFVFSELSTGSSLLLLVL